MDIVRKESGLQSRSVAGQITHWLKIGRAIEKSRDFDYQHISKVLEAEMSPDELSAGEQEIWFTQFASDMTKPSRQETAFFTRRQKLGRGVGLSESGNLVYQSQTKKP